MTRLAVVACGLAALGLAAWTLAGDCSVKETENAKFCVKCDKVLDAPDKQVDKDGNCKKCKEAVRDIELCVKKSYHCKGCKKDFGNRPT